MITKDFTIAEVLSANKNAADILRRHGMHCVGCPSMAHETIGEACEVHGMNVAEVIEELNAAC